MLSPDYVCDVLKLAGLAARWPGFDSWLPLKQLQGTVPPGRAAAAAAARPTLVSCLLQLGMLAPLIFQLMLRKVPLTQSHRLASALLQTHTLKACSRSLARAVDRLGVQVHDNTGLDPSPGVVGPDASGRLVAAPAAAPWGPAASTAAPAAAPAEGPLHALQYVLDVSTLAHQAVFYTLLRLPDDGEGNALQGNGSSGGSGSGGGGGGSGSQSAGCDGSRPVQTSLRLLLQEALADSALTEHLARGLLHLLVAGRRGQPSRLYTCFLHMYATATCLGTSGPLVLGGPCASYLATSAALQLLCTADGGSSYGMRSLLTDAEVLEHWLGVGGVEGNRDGFAQLWGPGSSSALGPRMLFGALGHAMMYRPPNSRTALDVLLRLGFAAVATAQQDDVRRGGSGASSSGAGSSGGGAVGGGLPPGLLPMDAATAALLSVCVLQWYRVRAEGLPEDGARRAAAEAEGWRLTCAVVTSAVEWVDEDDLRALAWELQLKLGPLPADGMLPAEPPPDLAAALAGGLLPCLERLVRRAAHRPAGGSSSGSADAAPWKAHMQLLADLMAQQGAHQYVAWTLTYGKPVEVAAFVSSASKLLRAAVAHQVAHWDNEWMKVGAVGGFAAVFPLLRMHEWVQTGSGCAGVAAGADSEAGAAAAAGAAARAGSGPRAPAEAAVGAGLPAGAGAGAGAGARAGAGAGAGTGTAGEEGGPMRQLRRTAVLAACEWLPALSQLLCMMAKMTMSPTAQARAQLLKMGKMVCVYASAIVAWLPLHTTADRGGQEEQQGWAQLRRVVQETGRAEVLAGCLRLLAYLEANGHAGCQAAEPTFVRLVDQLLAAGLLLATRSPGEVRRALACHPAEGCPAHCTWSSKLARGLVRGLPNRGGACGEELVRLLESWERGGGVPAPGVASQAPDVQQQLGIGMLDRMGAGGEAGQPPFPLRRCSWGRCTNLAGDSEAAVALQACSRCGEAWYCGRGCQVAHWREGHKAECGGE